VTQTDNSALDSHPTPLAARLAWIVLILATLYICYFHKLGAIGFVGPDEPRYAWIARDMAETGDWVTPRLYGKPWLEKPVLYYWGAALSFTMFGVSEAAARFPSALAALFATLAMAWLAWRVYGAETARWLLLLLPTTVGMIGFSHAAATDMPFAGMLTIAMVFAARLLGLVPTPSPSPSTSFTSSTPYNSFFLGFFLGLAVLAKGPAAIILAGSAVLLWAAFTKRWRNAFRCLHPIAVAGFCLTGLPWYILCARRNPDFFRVFIIEHNFKRFLTPEFQHIQPFWFYVPIILVAVFPWTILLVPAVRQILAEGRNSRSELASTLFLVFWSAFTLAFFTVSESKLPGYILPAIPPLGLLLTGALVDNLRNKERPQRRLTVTLGAGLLAAGIAFSAASSKLPSYTDISPAPAVTALAFTGVLAGVAIAILGLLRRAKIAMLAMVVFLLLLVARTDSLLSELDPGLTARTAPIAATRLWPEFSANRAATWRLKRSLVFQLNFYLHTAVAEWAPGTPKPEWLFVEPKQHQEVRALGFACSDYLVFPAVITCRNSSSMAGFSGLGALGGNHNLGERTDGDRQLR
jgi:4-amino-4-deoxy-L-arabinose transferase-like glycosyltransferase